MKSAPRIVDLTAVEAMLAELMASGEIPRFDLPQPFAMETKLRDLALDSLGRTSLLLAVEEKYGVSLGDVPLDEDSSFADVDYHVSMRLGDALRTIEELPALSNAAIDSTKVDSRETSLPDFMRTVSPDVFTKARHFRGFVTDFRDRHFDRYQLPVIERRQGRVLVGAGAGLGEREVVLFGSADYLDLSDSPIVRDAVAEAALRYGTSVSSVPTIAGNTDLHEQLRSELAKFLGYEDVVLFPTGYSANVGTIAALCSPHDFVVVDKQVHYSILEGVRLAGCQWGSFLHSATGHLEEILAAARARRKDNGILVVVEGVYGIDGDIAPLQEILAVARAFDARVLVDDAHATGVVGPAGIGSSALSDGVRPDLLMGSLSKSFASLGGWIATDRDVAEYLRYFAKSVVFSVGLPAPVIAGALAALRLIKEQPARVGHLQQKASRLRLGLESIGCSNALKSNSAIMSLRIGSEPTLRDVTRDLFYEGVWAEGLPFPAVPRGDERLRFRVRSSHTDQDIDETVSKVERVLISNGVLRSDALVRSNVTRGDDRVEDDAIVDLAVACSQASGASLPWISRAYFRKIVRQELPWSSLFEQSRWFTARDGGRVSACLLAQVPSNGSLVGYIGHVFADNGHVRQLGDLIDEAASYLSDFCREVVAPVNMPLQVLGGGCYSGSPTDPKPFLEQTYDDEIRGLLEARSFETVHTNFYTLHSVEDLVKGLGETPSDSIALRPLRRADLANEFTRLAPVFNATVARLPYCTALPNAALAGIAAEMKDAMSADLWWIANVDGREVGFVGAFADLSKGFADALGAAGVADIESINQLSDSAQRGFVAWMGVLPEWQGRGVGELLLSRVCSVMQDRRIRDAWLSWEICDADLLQRVRQKLPPPNFSRAHDVMVKRLEAHLR